MPSQFVWYELLTPDVEASKAFYSAILGWTVSKPDMGPASMDYHIANMGEIPVGGMMTLTPGMAEKGARPSWVGYVGVGDVDTAAAQAVELGGAICQPPMDIPEVGRFAVMGDVGGAAFILFKGNQDPPPEPPPMGAPGFVGWRELHAADGPAAFDFYAALFGWTKDTAMDMGPMGVYQLFAAGGPAIGAVMTKPPSVPAPRWFFYFTVPSVEAGAEAVKAKGGQVTTGPMEVPGGMWVIHALDPQGALFALVGGK